MRILKLNIAVLILFFGVFSSYGQNAIDFSARLNYQVALMQESKTADDVYIIKSRIDKLSQEANTLSDKRKILDAYLKMSDRFAFFNHFKSGVLVYFNCLEIEKELHQINFKAFSDSIQFFSGGKLTQNRYSGIKSQSPDGNDKKEVEAEYNSGGPNKGLESESSAISGSSNSSNVKWIIALALVILIMIFVFIGQRKKVSDVRAELDKDKTELKNLFRISANVSMLSGAIRYAREFSAHCAVVLKDLIEITNTNTESKADSTKASQAVDVFKRISSGDKKAL